MLFCMEELVFQFDADVPKSQDRALSFQNNWNVTTLERKDFKVSVGGLNNKFPNVLQGLLNILQSTSFCKVEITI